MHAFCWKLSDKMQFISNGYTVVFTKQCSDFLYIKIQLYILPVQGLYFWQDTDIRFSA